MQIIPKKILPVETHWQKELANSFTDLHSLLQFLEIDPKTAFYTGPNTTRIPSVDLHAKARKLFPMRVPLPFAELMEKGNWHDPLLQQVVPQYAEFMEKEGYVDDPLQEQGGATPGLIHKYQSRVLLLVRGGCAVNCRYCFRRHFPYQDNQLNRQQYNEVLSYIAKDNSLNEVIFSGGDPLMANDEQLAWLITQIEAIKHIKRLRIHTRLPVVIPQRVTSEFAEIVEQSRLKTVLVTHINHGNEISAYFTSKMQMLSRAGLTLLNQSVLLKGINNNANVLEDLSEKLFEAGILPYYLHMFDPVKGASHFDVSKAEAIEIMADLIKRLPGFLVPKLVKEIANRPGKTPIDLLLE